MFNRALITTKALSLLLLFGFLQTALANTSLWVAESQGVLKVATTDGEILFEIIDENGVDLVAINRSNSQIWTLGASRLKAYSANGVLEIDRHLPNNLQQHKAVDMAVDQSGIWLAAHKTLYRFDLQGRLLHDVRFRQAIQSMALDTARSQLWVAVSHKVFILDQHLNDINHFRTFFPFIPQLAYDEQLDGSWVVSGPYLLRLSNNNLDVEFLSRFGTGRWLWQHLSPDGDGGVWGGTQTTISHINGDGLHNLQFKPFQIGGRSKTHGYGNKIEDLTADPGDQSVWIASRKVLKKFDRVGAQHIELMPDLGDGVIRKINRIDLASDAGSAPVINIVQPITGSFINNSTPVIELAYTSDGTIDTDSIDITYNDASLNLNCTADQQSAECAVLDPFADGEITLQASVADLQGYRSEPSEVTFTVDTITPVITINSPSDGLTTNIPVLPISGQVSEAVQSLTLNHNGNLNSLSPANNAFATDVMLSEGSNTLSLNAVDYAGNSSTATFSVVLDTLIPAIPNMGTITVSRPNENGQSTVTGNAGSVEPNTRVTITNTRTGESISVTADADGRFTAQIAAEAGDTIQISVTDAAGNGSEPAQTVVTDLPPDPASVAPPLNPNQITPLLDATAFLYTGGNPIQTGVAPGTIEARRVAVIRGTVRDKQNNPLPGVTVSVHNHPELGQTLSRIDGMFDLAVNGGGMLTIHYNKENYLPVQRQVNAPWQDYVFADDIVMIGLDPQVTVIDLSSPVMQVAQGTPQTDEDGTRQATVLFPPGTMATMILPDGTQQALATLNVRATEYTVGENGPEAMPAVLPPTSGYTYAVELSIDEAIAVNATRVDFNQPLPFYVDNFLNFPTGEVVPIGYYDRERAVWVPSDNGRVIEILTIENNQAVLDVNGEGTAATQTELDELGINVGELEQIATLYLPGASFWRSPITHFTPWDCNWPYGPPDDAEPPPPQPPKTSDENDPDSDDKDPCAGCIVEPQGQIMGEEIPVVGTPYSLHYRSDRVLGRKTYRVVAIPVSEATLPSSLKKIELKIKIAGREFEYEFPALPNQQFQFEWDGLDAYGRVAQGLQTVKISINYVYNLVYYAARVDFARSFARLGVSSGNTSNGKLAVIGQRNTQFVRVARQWEKQLGLVEHKSALGGWSFDSNHYYDFMSRRLYLGNGDQRTANNLGNIIHTIAGTGVVPLNLPPSGLPATDVDIVSRDMTIAEDGTIYFVMGGNALYKIDQEGIISRVFYAIDGSSWVSWGFWHIDIGPDGKLYLATYAGDGRIFMLDPNAPSLILYHIAGSASNCRLDNSCGAENIPALSAKFQEISDIAVGADGSIYISDGQSMIIRRIGSDGIVTTVAGTARQRCQNAACGDGGLATDALLNLPTGIDVDSQGNIYFADRGNSRIRRIGTDGIITTVAGTGVRAYSGDGGLATDAGINLPEYVMAADDGSLYIAEPASSRIRRVGVDGIITTIAGNGEECWPTTEQCGDKVPAISARILSPNGLVIDREGYLLFSDLARIRKISSPFPGLGLSTFVIASQRADQLYFFNEKGQHLSTMNTLTGNTEFEFTYNNNAQLVSITDSDGDVTFIERDGAGELTAIIAPDEQRTELTQDANGYLATVVNPAGETYQMTYTTDGLMKEFRDRKNQLNTFEYDELGRLTRDINTGGGGWTLGRTELEYGYYMTMTSAEGRQLGFSVEPQPTGNRIQRNTLPNGTVQEKRFTLEGAEETIRTDGTVITLHEGPDPRFGMQSPVPELVTIGTPGGLISITESNRTVVLSDPSDPMTLQSLIETTAVNGRAFQTNYNATTRTYTRTSAKGRTATQTINEQGRPTTTQITGLAPIGFSYDARGRLENILAGSGIEQRSTQMSYYSSGSQAGWLQSTTDAANRSVAFEYDAVGRVIKQTLPDGRAIEYTHDANGNLTSLTTPNNITHTFNYNAFDLEGQYTPPAVTGITTPQTVYDYNLDKELVRITRSDAQQINFSYNNSAQLMSMVIPTGSYSYTYLPASGQLDTVTSPDGIVLDYSYDGFLLTGQSWSGDISGNVTQTYNNNFFVTQRCVNTSNCINAGYDNDGLLTSAGALTLTRDLQRAGLITSTTLSNVTTANSYNDFGELETVEANYQATELYDVVYARDDLGRVGTKTETVQGATITDVYTYDLAGRLDTVTRNGQLIDYDYDSNGNRLSRTEGANVESGVYDDQDRLLNYAGCSYAYTDNGELERKTCGSEVTAYNYDVLGNLLSVELPNSDSIEYVIDGQNRRVGKRVNGRLAQGFLYQDQLNPIAELNADGSVRSRFVYGDKINVPSYMIRDGVTYRIVSDHLGSPRLVINTNDGAIAQQIDYDEFGRVLSDTNPGFQPFGFAGGLYDQTGLVRFGARDYDTQTGRWTAKDPILFNGGLSNLYDYVFSDPINYIDFSGNRGTATRSMQQYEPIRNAWPYADLHDALSNLTDPRPYWEPPRPWDEPPQCACPAPEFPIKPRLECSLDETKYPDLCSCR